MGDRESRCLLKQLLEERRMSQLDLAILTGYTKQRINDYTTDRVVMSYHTARIIAKALRCRMEDLYS